MPTADGRALLPAEIVGFDDLRDAVSTDDARAKDAANAALATATDDLGAAQDEVAQMREHLENTRQAQYDDRMTHRDEVARRRAELARYTAVYGDPDAPVDVAHMFALGTPGSPLTPELAAMVDRILAGAVPDDVCIGKEIHDGTPLGLAIMRRQWDRPEMPAPAIKVGDHVRCESLGNLTGVVARITSTQSGGAGCIVRDDEMGHEWFAMADLLEVLP